MMNVDLNPEGTFLVADTSVLIRSLPMVRAVIESSVAYKVYVPYIVLTELDKGSTAAAVNRLLCREMKQKNPRVIAQGITGHQNVAQARGVSPKNDDLILGTALKLKEEGLKVKMLTNDNNLSAKSCANGISTWSSLDFLCKVKDAIPVMDSFIVKDLRELCSHAQHLFSFCTDLLACALKFRLKEQDQACSVNSGLVYRLIEKAGSGNLVSDSQLLSKTSQLIRDIRKKNRKIIYEDVQRYLKHACAILQTMSQDGTIASILNVCKGIYSGLKMSPKARSGGSLTSSVVDSSGKTSFKSLSEAQMKKIVEIVNQVDTKHKKVDGIRKNTSRRKSLPKVPSFDSEDYEEEMDTDGEEPGVESMSFTNTTVPTPNEQGTSRRSPTTMANSDMEIDSISKRPMQAFGPVVGEDVKRHHVYRMLADVWSRLNNISGCWASRCGIDYAWQGNPQTAIKTELTSLNDVALLLAEIDDDYSRLLKLGNGVAPELLLTISKRFIDSLRKVSAENVVATPREVVQFFQDDRTRDILLNAQNQLQAFRDAVIKCRKKETLKALSALGEEKQCS